MTPELVALEPDVAAEVRRLAPLVEKRGYPRAFALSFVYPSAVAKRRPEPTVEDSMPPTNTAAIGRVAAALPDEARLHFTADVAAHGVDCPTVAKGTAPPSQEDVAFAARVLAIKKRHTQPSLTIEQAEAQVYKEHPALYSMQQQATRADSAAEALWAAMDSACREATKWSADRFAKELEVERVMKTDAAAALYTLYVHPEARRLTLDEFLAKHRHAQTDTGTMVRKALTVLGG